MTRASPLPITKHHSDHKAAGKTAYVASHIKRRRSTRAEVEDRREKLFEIVEAMQPMTVRQVFYQATGRGIVEKSEAGYTKVQTDLVHMRRAFCPTPGWRIIRGGSGSRTPSAASKMLLKRPPASIEKPYGMTSMPTPRCG